MTAPVTLVLGGGVVGSAAVWDLTRRGHRVTIADRDESIAGSVGSATVPQSRT
jgi:saccharopine dehydrogenase-like NADP-dependent oxidoreductase